MSRYILCPASTKSVAKPLKIRESNGGEESKTKLHQNAVGRKQSELYSWFADAWAKHGTHFTLSSLMFNWKWLDLPFGPSQHRTNKHHEHTNRGSLHQSGAPGILQPAANGLVPAWGGHRVNRHGWVGVFR
ncbi:hypothetical protein PoB_005729200 [Plakobranchus ocellatus]|uniref:Uncharacterized protein n=1 Tax=Plakobranchus ocellatus TaxID=259542 RepID=A0AAV4CH93_9GAST|nr:hypothetical protein PoB_005729200 [Plakobranchus ocellatus]